MATEAAHLFVSVTADVDKGIRDMNRVNDAAGKSEGFLKGAAKQAIGFGTAMIGINAGAAVFGAIKSGAIDMNAQLETSTLQFETLMGDADKARTHVEGLFDFAAKTPFETGPIIEASRLMETFGGAALNSKKNLTTFGDAAAATGQPINEVSFWMSRAYAAIQAGKPWGEAAMRLGEMGIVTPQVRQKLEDLQASGAKGPEVWNALTGSLGKFDGAMEKQAGTFDGMMATFMDNMNMVLAKALFPLFEGLKGLLGWLNEVMSSPAFSGAMAAAAAAIGDAFSALATIFGVVSDFVGPIISALSSMFGVFKSGDDVVAGFFETFGNLQEKVFAALQQVIDWVLNEGVPQMAEALSQFGQKFIEWIGPAAEELGRNLPIIAGRIFDFLATNLPVIAGKLIEWAGAFIGWIGEHVLPKLPGALATVAGAIIGWIARTAPVVIGRVAVMGTEFVKMLGGKLMELPGVVARWLGQVIPQVVAWAGSMAAQGLLAAGKFAQSILDRIKKVPADIMAFLGQLPGMVLNWGVSIGKAAIRAAGDFVRNFINGLISLPGKIADAVRAAFRSIRIDIGPFHISASGVRIDLPNINLPSFATGAWNLPRDMVAQVHSGEMIVPKDIADRLRGGRGFSGPGGGDGGGDTIIVNVPIENYYGSEEHLDRLTRGIGERVRIAIPRRTVTAGAR